eukprot:TRINITY_DN1337_c0_g1_i9.p2 TRINITY_DN1337_c0_g1~~TRINITY_DN1337_c0_g1_i9.p2  ORF type:complete len:159 (-),score=10.67 TRINITY_DN1337_c0_g1_i9:117-593(-)
MKKKILPNTLIVKLLYSRLVYIKVSLKMGYCGFGTTGNQIKWGISIVCLVVSLAFLGAYFIVHVKGTNEYENCLEEEEEEEFKNWKGYESAWKYCEDQFNDDYGLQLTIFLVLGIIFLVFCTIPCYIMCCCTSKPSTYIAIGSYSDGTPLGTPYIATK